MTVYFTSDLHLGHRLVAGLRGYEGRAIDHDDRIRFGWEMRVGPKDDVWVLGDLAASSPTYALEFIATLPGRKHLVAGNHDRCHPMHRDAHNWQRRYLEVFDSVQPFARRRIDGRDVLLSHFPYTRDRGEPRHVQWRLRDEGSWLLHGHTHGQERVTITPPIPGTEFLFGPAREIHVGVDARDMMPVSLDEIAKEMRDASV